MLALYFSNNVLHNQNQSRHVCFSGYKVVSYGQPFKAEMVLPGGKE